MSVALTVFALTACRATALEIGICVLRASGHPRWMHQCNDAAARIELAR